jgi:hypothetical protein
LRSADDRAVITLEDPEPPPPQPDMQEGTHF